MECYIVFIEIISITCKIYFSEIVFGQVHDFLRRSWTLNRRLWERENSLSRFQTLNSLKDFIYIAWRVHCDNIGVVFQCLSKSFDLYFKSHSLYSMLIYFIYGLNRDLRHRGLYRFQWLQPYSRILTSFHRLV